MSHESAYEPEKVLLAFVYILGTIIESPVIDHQAGGGGGGVKVLHVQLAHNNYALILNLHNLLISKLLMGMATKSGISTKWSVLPGAVQTRSCGGSTSSKVVCSFSSIASCT